jgi:MFS family permease
MMLVAYFDRINLPQASSAIMASLHLNKAQWGVVLAAFTLGYGLMQAPGGHLADRFGSRRLLIAAIIVWSVFTGLTGLATSMLILVGIRFIFGVGEGLENGAQFKLVGEHFPPKQRAFANSLFLSALALGPAIGTPLATWQVVAFGWRSMFGIFAGIGLIVGIVLLVFLPKEARLNSNSTAGGGEETGFLASLRHPTSWLCACGYLLFNVAFWGFLSWVPTYLREDRHIPLAKSGLIGSLPYFAGIVGMAIAGYLGSSFLAHRKPVLVAACYLGASFGLLVALSAHETNLCVFGLCIGGFFLYGVFGPFWAIAIDLAPPTARGVFTGSVNCCGQIGAFSSQIIIGLLANQMKSFTGAILFMIAALTLGAVVMSVLQRLQQSSQAKAFV